MTIVKVPLRWFFYLSGEFIELHQSLKWLTMHLCIYGFTMHENKFKICQMNWILLYSIPVRNPTSRTPNRINAWMNVVTPVTPAAYHKWTRSHKPHTMNERGHTSRIPWMNRGHINSVPWMNAVINSVKSLSFSLSRGFFLDKLHSFIICSRCGPPFIHSMWLMRFGKMILQSTKISTKWLYKLLSGMDGL